MNMGPDLERDEKAHGRGVGDGQETEHCRRVKTETGQTQHVMGHIVNKSHTYKHAYTCT